jgi:hypothetical protein
VACSESTTTDSSYTTTDSGYVDYRFRLLRLQIPAMSTTDSGCYPQAFCWKKSYSSLLNAPLERHKSETIRIAKLSTTNSGCGLVLFREGEHLAMNCADYLTTTNSGNGPKPFNDYKFWLWENHHAACPQAWYYRLITASGLVDELQRTVVIACHKSQ